MGNDWNGYFGYIGMDPAWTFSTGYKVHKKGKNGDRRHKDNAPKVQTEFRRKGDKMPIENLTQWVIYFKDKEFPKKPVPIPRKTLRRRFVEWLIDY